MNKASIIQFAETTIKPMGEDRHILRTEFQERCYIYQSFLHTKSLFGGDYSIDYHMTFFADGDNGVAAEWEPRFGPIQLWTECAEDWTETTQFGGTAKAKAHWHFPFVRDEHMNWSQLAVEDNQLKQELIDGNLNHIFGVLMRWAEGIK